MGDKMKVYECSISRTHYCCSKYDFRNEEWQMRKLIKEAKLRVEFLIKDCEQLVCKPKSN
ncbi:MAG: hypothetical protein CMM80_06885 [Rhodospirillaceae bacterium]|nr:hypothetical protein [Rhodospirillaceae bacterium]